MNYAQDSIKALLEKLNADEVWFLENLEETQAEIVFLEQKMADQPGNKYLQNRLADARYRQGKWESFLSDLQRMRKLPR